LLLSYLLLLLLPFDLLLAGVFSWHGASLGQAQRALMPKLLTKSECEVHSSLVILGWIAL
jgi:hypothetical protein